MLDIQDSKDIAVEGVVFDQPGGNGLMLSNNVLDCAVRKCTFKDVGDSAIAILGSSDLMVGTGNRCASDSRWDCAKTDVCFYHSGRFPSNNIIESNLVDTVGVNIVARDCELKSDCCLTQPCVELFVCIQVYGKQTSAYFKAKARSNIVRDNVFMNGYATTRYFQLSS